MMMIMMIIYTKEIYVKGEVLYIKVSNPILKQEILEYNFDILEKIKKMDLEQLDKIIESNHIIKESLNDTIHRR